MYRLAAENLQEFCGTSLSYTLLGTLAEQIADEMNALLQCHPAIKKNFQQAKGETMFDVDGTSVHTRNADGTKQWREMKVDVLAKVTKMSERAPT